MAKKKIFLSAFLLLFIGVIFSDGILIPTEPVTEENPFVLLEHNVEININDLIATVEIDEVFWNDSAYTQKVIYLFPIPQKAIISDFKMKIGDTWYTGEIMDSDKAKEEFVELVKKNKNPALLEYMDEDYYRLEIPSFKPHEERAISLTYTQELENNDGLVSLQYPLEIESLLKTSIGKITISGVITSANSQIYFVDSSTNEIKTSIDKDKHKATFSFTKQDFDPVNDFVLKYGLGENEVEAYMSTDTPDLGYNTFLLEIHPNIDYDYYQSKEIVFVLDKSGSMSGIKYAQAQNAAEFILSRLYDDDRFNLILFNHDITAFKHYYNLFDSENSKEAIDWIFASRAGGNTNIYGSLDMALRVFQNSQGLKNPILVFLTDGLPTQGNTNPQQIVAHVNQMAKTINGLRIFAFGVGYDVNTYILDLLTANNNGKTFYVTQSESIETEIARLFSNISKPVLSDVHIEFLSDDVEIMDYIPNTGLTVYKDEPLKIFGRYKGSGKLSLRLSGRLGDRNFEKMYYFDVDNSLNSSISLLWASRQINNLLNQIRLTGETDQMKSEIVSLSKQFSIPTPYTSYLISDDKIDVYRDQGVPSLGIKQYSAAAPAQQTGKTNVVQSKSMNMMSQAIKAEEAEQIILETMRDSNYRLIKGKRFIWDEDLKAWIDDDFKDENVITIKKYSDEYFELIRNNKNLVDFMQLSENIHIFIDSQNYIFEE